MTRSTSVALDCPATRPRPSKLAQPVAVRMVNSAATRVSAMQVLETDPNADSSTSTSAEDSKAAARLRFIDDIHLAHHAVHGHLDGERDRDAGIAVAAHVPAPHIPLHLVEALHLIGRAEEVAHLLGTGRSEERR